MFTLISEQIEQYCEDHTSSESTLLHQLNRETHIKILRPRMLSGQLQGTFLSMISKMIHPQYILEVGTYTGYSSLCLAEGLQKDGELHTLEIEEELEVIILKYFNQSNFKDQIHLHIGDASQLLDQIRKEWDLVFIDAEKKDYQLYYEKIFPHVKKGGFILVDNVLWSGKVIEEIKPNDKETGAIVAFNDYIQNDPRVKNTILPFRDGIMLIEKL
ncbi:MAG: methyltransferase [Bacteroidetes bacterium]|nr:methyltransferase [Bacteroidota bacterium]